MMNKRRQLIFGLGGLTLFRPFKALFGNSAIQTQDPDQAFFEAAALEEQLKASGKSYLPFLNVEKLRTGLYALPAGAEDRQQPHDHDEVYYVMSGKSKFVSGEEHTEVKAGSVLYVKAKVAHRFYEIEEDLKIIVFFSNMT